MSKLATVQTDRAHSDRLAGEHERHLRSAIEHAPIGMAFVSSAGLFTEVNPAFCALVGRAAEDLVGTNVYAITHPDDVAADIASARAAVEGGHQSYRTEKRYLSIDGRAVHVQVVVAVVHFGEGDHSFIAQCIDISARKAVETAQAEALRKERRLVAELREVERLRAEFVATASHELRTPLVSMLGYLELAADDLHEGAAPEGVASLIDSATRNARRLQALTDDLLAIAQLEAGTVPKRLDPVGIATLVARVAETIGVIARQSDVDLETDVGPSAGWVIGDETQLERMLLNLVGNAVKFTEAGGTVRIVAGWDTGLGDKVTIQVADDGAGIDPTEQDKLFTRFFRSSLARENAVAGTGLGLAIAREAVEAHDGTISVVSELGVGSVFTVVLPRTQRVEELAKLSG